jgi:hypothetical protein
MLGSIVAVSWVRGQEAVTRNVDVEAEELSSAYGAPPDVSHGRISTLTKSYVLPPFSFELESLYEGDVFRQGPPRHLFGQEIEMGLPARLTLALENQVERFNGEGGERSFGIEARYALANWNKIPFNPTVSTEYKFGIGRALHDDTVRDTIDFALLLSHDFPHLIEWAMNVFVGQEVNGGRSTDWGFAQSVEVPVLLPEERLEVGLEMQYHHAEETVTSKGQARGFIIGPTLAIRPTKYARLDLSPLIGCTGEAPRVQIFVVFSWSFGKTEAGEMETPASTRVH